MGESNASHNRPHFIRRDTLKKSNDKYKGTIWDKLVWILLIILTIELYSNPDGSVPSTFQLLYFIGWKPDKSHAAPAKRGSGSVSIADLGNIVSKKWS